jgi:uncharacterized membrane protein YkvA (DUF1232 family)
MAAKPIKVTFTLDESDTSHFRGLYRDAKKGAASKDPAAISEQVRALIERVSKQKKVASFVRDAVDSLEAMIQMIEDKDYAMPKTEVTSVVAALAYFAEPHDLIPDSLPGLGFLDDAIMIKLVEEEFEHEIWGYRKFRGGIASMEQRPWTAVAQGRREARVTELRKQVRGLVSKRKSGRRFLW